MSKRNLPAYVAMLAESKRTGLPRAFATDLTKHDRAHVERHPAEPFLWCLYAGGTHLLSPKADHPAYGTYRGLEYAQDLMATLLAFEDARLYEWDGTALLPCTADRAAHLYAGVPEES